MANTKIIFACDQSTWSPKDEERMTRGAPFYDYLKLGLEAMTAEDEYGISVELRARRFCAEEMQKGIFKDIKILDILNTVEKAVINICKQNVRMFTLHAQASDKALAAAAEISSEAGVIALAVTVLTDLDDEQCISRFSTDSASTVARFAKNAYARGIRGFVCSAHETRIIRDAVPGIVRIVNPAIRPLWAVKKDEQARVTTPTQAAQAGADDIVVGRPMSEPPPEVGSIEHAGKLIREELFAA